MNVLLQEAIALTKIQASTRAMSEQEMQSMILGIASALQGIKSPELEEEQPVIVDWKRSIRPKSILCLECGQSFKILTKKHLAKHDLDPVEYRATHGMPKGTPLLAKELSKARRERMKGIQLWKRKRGAGLALPESGAS